MTDQLNTLNDNLYPSPIDGPYLTARAQSAITIGKRLILVLTGSVRYWALATAAQRADAYSAFKQAAAEDLLAGELVNKPGTFLAYVTGTIAAGARAYAAVSGQVQPLPAIAGTYYDEGKVIKGRTGAGYIEILRDGLAGTTQAVSGSGT